MALQNYKDLGEEGELIASSFLQRQGLKILDRNYRCPLGEIDIIALQDHTLIFVEVKTRKSLSFGLPHEAVTKTKQKKLVQVAHYYLKMHSQRGLDTRFDVVSIYKDKKGGINIDWIKNVLETR